MNETALTRPAATPAAPAAPVEARAMPRTVAPGGAAGVAGAIAGVDVITLGRILARSGYFKDASDEAQAVVRILYGAELGVGPITAMMGIYVIEGRPAASANIIAARVRRSPAYDYRILEWNDERCEIQIMRREAPSAGSAGDAGGWREEGRVLWTMADAERAELSKKPTWRRYPRAMLFSRAISEAARAYCPELFGGAPAYTPEELGAEVDPVSGELLAPAEPPLPPPLPAAAAQPAEPVAHDLAYWRRRAMALYADLGGDPANRDASRDDFARILGIEKKSRAELTEAQWRALALHMEAQRDAGDAPAAATPTAGYVAGAEAGTFADQAIRHSR